MSVPDPNTEKEVFLAKAAGASETLPLTNSTREEIYLRAIAQGGGGGGGSDLPDVTSADEGKVLKVNASGEWATGQDDGQRFVITLTENNRVWTADKTKAEMTAALSAGMTLCVAVSISDIPCIIACSNVVATESTIYGILFSGKVKNPTTASTDFVTDVIVVYYDMSGIDIWTVIEKPLITPLDAWPQDTVPLYVAEMVLGRRYLGAIPAYTEIGSNTDGTMTQAAITTAISEASPYYKIDTTTASLHSTFRTGFTALFNSVLASAVAAVGTRVSSASSFSCSSVTNLLALCLGLAPKVPQLLVTAASETTILFLSSQYYNHYFFRAFIPYNDGTNDYNVDCMFMINPAGMTIAMTAYAA